jgi:hypothetical protein
MRSNEELVVGKVSWNVTGRQRVEDKLSADVRNYRARKISPCAEDSPDIKPTSCSRQA